MFSIKLELTPPTDRTAEDPAPQQEWRYFEASLPTFPIESYPLEFHSLWLSVRPEAADIIYNLHTALDDISIRDGLNGEISVLEDFESIQRIWQTNDERISASFTRKLPAHSGSGTIMLWMPGRSSVQNTTLYPAGKLIQDPLPVLASPEFLAATQLNVGDEVESFIWHFMPADQRPKITIVNILKVRLLSYLRIASDLIIKNHP